jgi:hypothetical protein
MLHVAAAVLALATADTGRAAPAPIELAQAPAAVEVPAVLTDAALPASTIVPVQSLVRIRPAEPVPTATVTWSGPPAGARTVLAPGDTIPRPTVVDYSEGYATRLKIHRIASYTMLPLFAAQYASGQQLIKNGRAAPAWARDIHGPTATGVAALFTINTVTGVWNMWEARKDPAERTRRTLHGLLMLAADAGFTATGILASGAGDNGSRRNLHRDVAYGSMAVSLVSYAIMLPPFRRNQ